MMNPETREFEPLTDATPKGWARFEVGERIAFRGWWWRVEKCSGGEVVLHVQEPTKGGIKRGVAAGKP